MSDPLRSQVGARGGQLGYLPHAGARALMLKRSGTVGAVFPTIDNAIFAHRDRGTAAPTGRVRRAIAAGHQRLRRPRRKCARRSTSSRAAPTGSRCAVIASRPNCCAFCGCGACRCVHVMTLDASGQSISVGFDNAAATRQVVRYLLDLGHRRIAMLAGTTRDNDRATQRVAGVRDALAAAGLTLAPERLVERRYSLAEARTGLRELLAHTPAPTALICGNDVLAFGALLEAQSIGLRRAARPVDRRLRRSGTGAPSAARADHRAGADRAYVGPGRGSAGGCAAAARRWRRTARSTSNWWCVLRPGRHAGLSLHRIGCARRNPHIDCKALERGESRPCDRRRAQTAPDRFVGTQASA